MRQTSEIEEGYLFLEGQYLSLLLSLTLNIMLILLLLLLSLLLQYYGIDKESFIGEPLDGPYALLELARVVREI